MCSLVVSRRALEVGAGEIVVAVLIGVDRASQARVPVVHDTPCRLDAAQKFQLRLILLQADDLFRIGIRVGRVGCAAVRRILRQLLIIRVDQLHVDDGAVSVDALRCRIAIFRDEILKILYHVDVILLSGCGQHRIILHIRAILVGQRVIRLLGRRDGVPRFPPSPRRWQGSARPRLWPVCSCTRTASAPSPRTAPE